MGAACQSACETKKTSSCCSNSRHHQMQMMFGRDYPDRSLIQKNRRWNQKSKLTPNHKQNVTESEQPLIDDNDQQNPNFVFDDEKLFSVQQSDKQIKLDENTKDAEFVFNATTTNEGQTVGKLLKSSANKMYTNNPAQFLDEKDSKINNCSNKSKLTFNVEVNVSGMKLQQPTHSCNEIKPINIVLDHISTNVQNEEKSCDQLKEEKRQRNRIRAVDELISTEKTYVNKLELLNKLYVDPIQTNIELLKKPNHHSIIFPVIIQTILALNIKLFTSMESNKNQIGHAMYDFIPYLKMYQTYMNNHEAATRLIKQYRNDTKSEFTKYLISKELQQRGFTLESYLILPIQRIPRYELMLKEIIKLTKDGHEDKENLIKCYDKVAAVNKQINIRLKDYEIRQKVHDIEMRIVNLQINKEQNGKKSSINIFNKANKRLVQPSRVFIKQAYFTKVSRKKDIKYLFILFNDLLIYCSETMNNKLILHQKLDITDEFFRIESGMVKNTFEIHSIEKSFLCYAENVTEIKEWVEAIEKCLNNIKNNNLDAKTGEDRILETAPIWIPNDWTDECMISNCNNKFSTLLLKKRNHCRYCGGLVCSECCINTLPHYEPKKRKGGVYVKVCNNCYDKYKQLLFDSMNNDVNDKGNNKENCMKNLQIEEGESESCSVSFDETELII